MKKNNTLIYLGLLLGLAVGASTHAAASLLPLHTEGRNFVDSSGRTVLLRGVNVSNTSKVPPFNHLNSLEELKTLKKLGLNNTRLLFNWEAFEPKKGEFDLTYLDRVHEIVKASDKLGIYTVIDFHSDAFSRFAIDGCGSGFPGWIFPEASMIKKPDNGKNCEAWAVNAIREFFSGGDMKKISDAFFSDSNGSRTEFFKMLSLVANRLKDEPSVVGYDILNEPWADEATQIAPFYELATAVIRKEAPNAIIFVEPFVFVVNTLSISTLPKPKFTQFVYASHNYDPIILGFKKWHGGDIFHGNGANNIKRRSLDWNVPVYIGEFGAPAFSEDMRRYVFNNYRIHDNHFFSSAQWVFNSKNDSESYDGWNQENMAITDNLGNTRLNFQIRAYPQKISGVPISFKFVDDLSEKKRPSRLNAVFELKWKNNPQAGTTEIFFPNNEILPYKRLEIKTSNPELKCSYSSADSLITCKASVEDTLSIQVFARGIQYDSPLIKNWSSKL